MNLLKLLIEFYLNFNIMRKRTKIKRYKKVHKKLRIYTTSKDYNKVKKVKKTNQFINELGENSVIGLYESYNIKEVIF